MCDKELGPRLANKTATNPGQNNFLCFVVPHLLHEFGVSHGQLGFSFALGAVVASVRGERYVSNLDRCTDSIERLPNIGMDSYSI